MPLVFSSCLLYIHVFSGRRNQISLYQVQDKFPQGDSIQYCIVLYCIYHRSAMSTATCHDANSSVVSIQMYADDTAIYTWGRDTEQVATKLLLLASFCL